MNTDDLPLTKAERENLTQMTLLVAQEAAMCAWEHLLEKGQSMDALGGYAQARLCCAAIAEGIHVGYCIYNKDDCSYDWDFVPWFVDNCVIWDSPDAYVHGEPALVPDWVERCRKLDFSAPAPAPAPRPDPEELLRLCLWALNAIPNQKLTGVHFHSTYALAGHLQEALK